MMSNWYGNFSGPIDADGREIPLDTKVLYDANGKKLNITRFIFECDTHGCWADWRVFSQDINCEDGTLYVDGLYLTAPDTWEKLEKDIDFLMPGASAVCRYFGDGESIDCDICPAEGIKGPCIQKALHDGFRRAKALAERGADD